jgi:hypothetical protein
MRRVLLIGGVVVLAVVAVALLYLRSNLDSIVANAIETYGTQAAGVPVRVGSVQLALTEGKCTISGLRVGNPEGYASGDAFRLGEISVQVDPKSVTSSPVSVPQVRVIAPEVNAQLDSKGKSNLQTILDHVEAQSGEAPAEEGEPVRLAIGSFVFEEGMLRGDASALSGREKDAFQTNLPAVRLRNIGGAGGATPAEISEAILEAFLGQTTKSVAAYQAQRAVEEKVGGSVGKEAGNLLRKMLE